MKENEWAQVLNAYRYGLVADMVQFRNVSGDWGVIWTVPAKSPEALERAARQAIRCRAVQVRHIRRGHLVSAEGQVQEVVVLTEAAPIVQIIRCLPTAHIITPTQILTDHGLNLLLRVVSKQAANKDIEFMET